jgi:hypothetical protein
MDVFEKFEIVFKKKSERMKNDIEQIDYKEIT